MIDLIFSLLGAIFGFLNDVLPDSPFASFVTESEAVQTGLAWLNWFLPVSDLLAIFGVYLGLLLAWTAADFALDVFGKTKELATGK